MYESEHLEKILELLNSKIDDSKQFIIDNNGNHIRINRDDDDTISFSIGEMTFIVNKESITINICEKSIEISKDEFFYQRKKNNTKHNAITFRLYGNIISFYRSDDDDISGKLQLTCDNNHYTGMTTEFSMIENKDSDNKLLVQKKNKYYIDGEVIKKDTTHSTFSRDGKKSDGRSESSIIDQPLYSIINDEISENTLIPGILNELNETIPGLVKYLGTRNSKIDEIAKIVKSKQKK